jgi:ABC-type sugar transport system ATPase subunit
MSDRIVVLHEGSLAGSIENRDEFSQEKIMAYASGK